MRREIQMALSCEPDFSESFTKKVAALGEEIGDKLGVKLKHDTDMNYSAAQRLQLCLNSTGYPVESSSQEARWQVDFFLSSKGPLFAYRVFAKSGNVWATTNAQSLAKTRGQSLVSGVIRELEERNFKPVAESEWQVPALGFVTEMDGAPAKVFDVLFSELL